MIVFVACGILLGMRSPMQCVFAVLLVCAAGCVHTPPKATQEALAGNLQSWQLLEAELLELIPADLPPVDFSTVGGTAEAGAPAATYRPRDGWRIILRAGQLRAASLVAWSRGQPFDQAAGVQALIVPAVVEAKRNLPAE